MIKEIKLQKKILKIKKLLDEMSALLPGDIKSVYSLGMIYKGIRDFSDVRLKDLEAHNQ